MIEGNGEYCLTIANSGRTQDDLWLLKIVNTWLIGRSFGQFDPM